MIFIDTGAFIGRYVRKDQHHAAAVGGWSRLATERVACATSNFVLDETFTLLGRWAGYPYAAERAREIYRSAALTILRPTEADERGAVDLFVRYADQAVSFTDCVSFSLMRRHGITSAFSFDRHFEQAGFHPWS